VHWPAVGFVPPGVAPSFDGHCGCLTSLHAPAPECYAPEVPLSSELPPVSAVKLMLLLQTNVLVRDINIVPPNVIANSLPLWGGVQVDQVAVDTTLVSPLTAAGEL